MIKMYVKAINQMLDINYGIVNLFIENIDFYRCLYYDLDDEIILSNNNIEINLSKEVMILKNIFELDYNDKKIIKLLHKHLEKKLPNNLQERFLVIQRELLDLIEEVIDNDELKLTYKSEFSIAKLFSLYQLEFEELDYKNYIESLLQYLNQLNYFTSIKIYICYGLMNYISNEEFLKIKKDLELLNIILINFEKFTTNKFVDYIIDEDYCAL